MKLLMIYADRFGYKTSVKTLESAPETDEEKVFQLVGPDESDVDENKISVFSPLGNALLGKRADEIVEVDAPRGVIEYEILEIIVA